MPFTRLIKLFGLTWLVAVSTTMIYAEIQVGRYATIQPVATASQRDVLSTVVSVSFDHDVKTVGHAIQQVLTENGYQLSDAASDNALRATLLSLYLPAPHRHLGPLSIRDILDTLTGPSWVSIEDPVLRKVSFKRCM